MTVFDPAVDVPALVPPEGPDPRDESVLGARVVPSAHQAGNTAFDQQDLVPILAFIRGEIGQSGAVLTDLANRLSAALNTLATADDLVSQQASLAEASIALQNEDRIQQRLGDLVSTLAVLERVLTADPIAADQIISAAGLNQTVFADLRLEETRHAFQVAAGLIDPALQPAKPVDQPSVGDIDLF